MLTKRNATTPVAIDNKWLSEFPFLNDQDFQNFLYYR
jgi:hypothetical protein